MTRAARWVRSLILGCTACGGRETTPAKREVVEALGARSTMTREAAMRMIEGAARSMGVAVGE